MNSSWSSTVTPLTSLTGTTERAKRPSAHALAARALDSTAKVSTSSREKPSRVAIRSAPMPWGTNAVAKAVAGSEAQAPPSLPMATRLIDSTPPAKIRSSKPPRTREAAWLTASRPEAQKRFSCTPATVSGRPAASAAVLAMSPPWSPIGETTPSTTSSTRLTSSEGLRSWTSLRSPTTRSTGFTSWRLPFFLPLPRGVRIASYTNASVAMCHPCFSCGSRGAARAARSAMVRCSL